MTPKQGEKYNELVRKLLRKGVSRTDVVELVYLAQRGGLMSRAGITDRIYLLKLSK